MQQYISQHGQNEACWYRFKQIYQHLCKKNNSKDLTFEVRDHVRISKYRKIEQLLQKFALEVGLQKFLWLKK